MDKVVKIIPFPTWNNFLLLKNFFFLLIYFIFFIWISVLLFFFYRIWSETHCLCWRQKFIHNFTYRNLFNFIIFIYSYYFKFIQILLWTVLFICIGIRKWIIRLILIWIIKLVIRIIRRIIFLLLSKWITHIPCTKQILLIIFLMVRIIGIFELFFCFLEILWRIVMSFL